MEDEENQVRGFVHFADGSGVGFAYLTLFTIREAVRIVKNGEVCFILVYQNKLEKVFYIEKPKRKWLIELKDVFFCIKLVEKSYSFDDVLRDILVLFLGFSILVFWSNTLYC